MALAGPSAEIDPAAAHWAEHAGDYAAILFESTHVVVDSMRDAARDGEHAACDAHARSIRHNIMLARRLAEPLRPPADPDRRASASQAGESHTDARDRIVRDVEQALEQRDRLRAERTEPLEPEERLDLETPATIAEPALCGFHLAPIAPTAVEDTEPRHRPQPTSPAAASPIRPAALRLAHVAADDG